MAHQKQQRALRRLFPELRAADMPFLGAVEVESVYALTPKRHLRLPAPPPMWNHGNYVASLSQLGRWLAEVNRFLRRKDTTGAAFGTLSAREAEIVVLIAEGLDNAQVAARLAISEKTVRNHITRIYDKLEVPTRAQLIVLAHDAGLRLR